ncbi:MAG: DNA polymerase III subunit delta [Bacteroidales bacterium]|jgi:DNA polymerase-3 subunit delta|nr:DNA polymerase III subunit delta [Bacteroidales bacterium]MCI1785825.1 DNA polymerase III subunit delta [Bacteroidales bacterium]
MSNAFSDTDKLCRQIVGDVSKGIFKPVYLLMGTEPYYTDVVCKAIADNALTESERDFNQVVLYGPDTDAGTVITAARQFPMMSERLLVVLKEAQAMRSIEQLSIYCSGPLDSTVLIICMHGSSADKRKALYKSVMKSGIVVESNVLRDYEMSRWITEYYGRKGLSIDNEAAALLGEFAGTDLTRISVETDKMLKNLPEGTKTVTVSDIEKNVGISREFSIFELTKELSYGNAGKALKIAAYIGKTPKFAMPMAVSAMFTHFYRILKYDALLSKNRYPDSQVKARILGVNPYFFREYDAASANYPLGKCMKVISLLDEYDYKGKGGDSGYSSPDMLLMELVTKILNV